MCDSYLLNLPDNYTLFSLIQCEIFRQFLGERFNWNLAIDMYRENRTTNHFLFLIHLVCSLFPLRCVSVIVAFFGIICVIVCIIAIAVVVLALRFGWILVGWFTQRKLFKPISKECWPKFIIMALWLGVQIRRELGKQPFELWCSCPLPLVSSKFDWLDGFWDHGCYWCRSVGLSRYGCHQGHFW